MFLHNVQEGPASQSYGIQVAKLAGVPDAVIADAQRELQTLENSVRLSAGETSAPQQTELFEALAPNALIKALKDICPDDLSPKAALEAIYALKSLVDDD